MASALFDGVDDFLEMPHQASWALNSGTIALRFTADDVAARHTLFSKDWRGAGAGGELTAVVRDGRVEARLESTATSATLRSEYGMLRPGVSYDVAITFGSSGFRLYLDGQLQDWRPDFTTGLAANTRSLILGASAESRDSWNPTRVKDYFDGVIDAFEIYDRPLTRLEVAALDVPAPPAGQTQGSSHSGLDQIVDAIYADPGLARSIPAIQIAGGAQAADQMNVMLIAAIQATGVANDGTLNAADLYDVNNYLRSHSADAWSVAHGDDEGGVETGFHQVQGDGGKTYWFGDDNAINTVADGLYHLGFTIEWGRVLNEDGDANASLKDLAFWLNELLAADLSSGSLANPLVDLVVEGSTGTGLDRLVELIQIDPGLNRSIATSQIVGGAAAADAMNGAIVEAIRATGVANDGTLDAADIRDVNRYLNSRVADAWKVWHGDDEEGEESGFHLVQDDGATTVLFGDSNAVNTVADGIYHLGFAICDSHLLNEDGNANASLADVAFWLNELLADDLASGELSNADVDLAPDATTHTGLDQIVAAILVDPGLRMRVASSEIAAGASAADGMSRLIVEAIRATGVANDGAISPLDVRDINAFLRANHLATWLALHGDDEEGFETGFHLVQNDGAKTTWFGDENAINTVADGLFHLGFEIRGDRLVNEDGDANASLRDVAYWLNELLASDLAGTTLDNVGLAPNAASIAAAAVFSQPTVTVKSRRGFADLAHRSAFELAEGTFALRFTADSVAGARTLFSKDAKGFGAGGHLSVLIRDGRLEFQLQTASQTYVIKSESGSIRAGKSYHVAVSFGPRGMQLYLDGEVAASRADVTTGLAANREKLVIGAGSSTRDARNRTATVDHFEGTVEGFTLYRRALARAEVASLAPAAPPAPTAGTTGTGLDHVVDVIRQDPGLARSIPAADILAGANAANSMNQLLVEAIRATGVANDRTLDAADLRDVNAYLRGNRLAAWTELHGDDEAGIETGFHLVQDDGATTRLFGDDNAVNTVADGIYHLGFEICGEHLLNEDGNSNTSLRDVAFWLSEFLADDLAAGRLANPLVSLQVVGTTGVGLDQLIQIIDTDRGLHREIASSHIADGARAADAMNVLIIEAIRATGVANDGQLDAADLRDVNRYLREHHAALWTTLHGDDADGVETGFHLVQDDGGTSRLFGDDNAIDTIADGIYHLGFEICGEHLLNEDGNANASLRDVAYWLSELLADDLRSGALANPLVDLSVDPTASSGLDQIVTQIQSDTGLQRSIATSRIHVGAVSANELNALLVEALRATGAANDGAITVDDVRDVNAYLRAHHEALWAELHGDDEGDEETGFHSVQNDGSRGYWFGDDNAIDTVADGLYHLGFGVSSGRLLNEDGNANASLRDVAFWLNELLAADLAAGSLVNSQLVTSREQLAADRVFSLDDLLD